MNSLANTSSFVYLDSLLDKGEPIYVRNTSKTRGVVVLTLNDGNKTHREAIPNTKYPICLTQKATPQAIRNSRDLRTLLDKGVLSLVAANDAEKELSNPEVRQALFDAYERLGAGSAAVRKSRGLDTDDGIAVDTSEGVSEFPTGDLEDAESETDLPNVQVRVQTLVESLASKDMKSRQVKSELMTMDLTTDDLTFLISNTQGIVQKFAKEEFAKKGGHPLDDEDESEE